MYHDWNIDLKGLETIKKTVEFSVCVWFVSHVCVCVMYTWVWMFTSMLRCRGCQVLLYHSLSDLLPWESVSLNRNLIGLAGCLTSSQDPSVFTAAPIPVTTPSPIAGATVTHCHASFLCGFLEFELRLRKALLLTEAPPIFFETGSHCPEAGQVGQVAGQSIPVQGL